MVRGIHNPKESTTFLKSQVIASVNGDVEISENENIVIFWSNVGEIIN